MQHGLVNTLHILVDADPVFAIVVYPSIIYLDSVRCTRAEYASVVNPIFFFAQEKMKIFTLRC